MNQALKNPTTIIRRWLWAGAFLIFLILIIGGITRLTDSGLSMSDWNLIMGAIPPVNEVQWETAFERYKEFPQYQKLNAGMSLEEFKSIYFWEYLHRLLARILGIVFIIPFLYFLIRGYLSKQLLRRLILLMLLGALQGAMGWIMVKSGLSDVPYVSHYRLAMHLLLAFLLIELCIWYGLDLREGKGLSIQPKSSPLKSLSIMTGVLFLLQIIWGAFTAGLDAGYIYNTFPLMNGSWLPQNPWAVSSLILNLSENPGMVQWVHRVLGTLLGGVVIWLWVETRKAANDRALIHKADLLLVIMFIQYILGVLTVLYYVPISIGVMHQAGAMVFGVAWLIYFHHLIRLEKNKSGKLKNLIAGAPSSDAPSG